MTSKVIKGHKSSYRQLLSLFYQYDTVKNMAFIRIPFNDLELKNSIPKLKK